MGFGVGAEAQSGFPIIRGCSILDLLSVIVEIAGLFSAAAILVFSLGQTWLAVIYRQSKKNAGSKQEALPPWSGPLPTVLLQLPIYNEQYVVERLLRNVACMDYPADKLNIQLLDDSSDETTTIAARVIAELKTKGFNISHIRRPERTGFKAGALDYGLKLDNSDFVAIFDADFMPRPDFVKGVLAYFTDASVGMVQTRWEHLNADYSIITRMMAFAIDNHFSVEHGGRQASDSFINFNGTGGMWRRKTIEDAGGWRSDTLTEDLDLSFRSQIRGWKFLFTETITTPSELPVQMSAVRSQQFRWTKGAAETGRKTLSNLWSSDARVLTKLVGSFHMLNSSIFLFLAIFAAAVGLLPFLPSTHFMTIALIMNLMMVSAVVANLFTYWTSQTSGNFAGADHSPLSLIYTTIAFMAMATGLCLQCSLAVVQGLFGKQTPFVRTPKLDITAKGSRVKSKKAYDVSVIPPVVYLELIAAGLFIAFAFFGLGHPMQIFAPTYLFFAAGFIVVSTLSLREAFAS